MRHWVTNGNKGHHFKNIVLTEQTVSDQLHTNIRLGSMTNTLYAIKIKLILLGQSFVRYILEYCCTTWSTHNTLYMVLCIKKDIEQVQRRATELV